MNSHALAIRRRQERALRAARRAKGLCSCGKPPRPGFKTCEACVARTRRAMARARRRQNIAALGFHCCRAVSCQSEAVPGRAYCDYHLELRAEQVKRRRQRRIAAGLCDDCAAPAVPGRCKCAQHLEEAKLREREKRSRAKRKAMEEAS